MKTILGEIWVYMLVLTRFIIALHQLLRRALRRSTLLGHMTFVVGFFVVILSSFPAWSAEEPQNVESANISTVDQGTLQKESDAAQVQPKPADEKKNFDFTKNLSKKRKTTKKTVQEDLPKPKGLDLEGELKKIPFVYLNRYNIFTDLPKRAQDIRIYYPGYSDFSYGPYKASQKIYDLDTVSLPEVKQRISVLSKLVDQYKKIEESKGQDALKSENVSMEELSEIKAHLADLYGIRYALTKKKSFLIAAASIYKSAYKDISSDLKEVVLINLTNCLVHKKEYITAFPIIKALKKEHSIKNSKIINQTVLDFYFMSRRYHKAESIIDQQIKNKLLSKETLNYQIRTGDVLYFLNRYEDAAEWYQTILEPKENQGMAESLSWLYLAEALHQLNDRNTSKKIYKAMKPFFAGTVFESVITFRLTETITEREALLDIATHPTVASWMSIELLTEQYLNNPKVFTAQSFDNFLRNNRNLPKELVNQVVLLQGFSYKLEKDYYKSIRNFRRLEMFSKNRFIQNFLNKIVIQLIYELGMSTKTLKEATKFLRFMITLKYNLKSHSPEKIYYLIYHNLDIIGLVDASAELTLKIIDLSVHSRRDKNLIMFKMARDMHNAFGYRQSVKLLEQLDKKLLSYDQKSEYYQLLAENYLETKQVDKTLEVLDHWSKEGATPKQSYWIATKKIDILYDAENYSRAVEIIDNLIGDGNVDKLPKDYQEYVSRLLAYQTIIFNKLGRNNECLVAFSSYQDRILQTDLKEEIIYAAVSSALSMRKEKDLDRLLKIAKNNLDERSYIWLDKWTKGEMWINQINGYLDRSIESIQQEG